MRTYLVTMNVRREGAIGAPTGVTLPVELNLDAFNSDDWRVRSVQKARVFDAFTAHGWHYSTGPIRVGAEVPVEGEIYRLTGGPSDACIANGDSWEDSKIDGGA